MVIFMMYGLPASGKTFTAKQLSEFLDKSNNVNFISTLDFRVKFGLLDLKSEPERERVYKLLTERVKIIIENNECDILIIDGNFSKRSRRCDIYSLVAGNNNIYVIKCFVKDKTVICVRLKERQENPDMYENKASTIELYDLIRHGMEPVEEDDGLIRGDVGLINFNTMNNKIENICYAKNDRSGLINYVSDFLNSIKGDT